MIDWTEIIVSICTILLTGVVIPLIIKYYKIKVSKNNREVVEYWATIGVKWAKQWLQTEEGSQKKSEVMTFVTQKLESLHIDVDEDDLDHIIEAIYSSIKNELQEPMKEVI